MRSVPVFRPIRHAALAAMVAVAGYAGAASLAQAATVDVKFLPPEQYTDIGYHQVPAIDPLGELKRYLVSLGQKLPASETLTIEVLDIDLAGMSKPVPGRVQDLRILRGSADVPRISLTYALTDQGRMVKNGKADLVDLAYLDRPVQVNAPEQFPYEKRLLADWFQRTFGVTARAGLHD